MTLDVQASGLAPFQLSAMFKSVNIVYHANWNRLDKSNSLCKAYWKRIRFALFIQISNRIALIRKNWFELPGKRSQSNF
jgi:hypothetical protein